ncbi:MAG: TSUP family transporter [Treponema sp.]|nr:TSUP family transporter [Treponema sp.]
MEFHASPLAYVFLIVASGVASFIDSIAGGGGIITLPALLAAGMPPHLALGTNKLQASFGSLTATIRFGRAGLIKPRDVIPGVLATAAGAALGAIAVGAIDGSILKILIPILLVAIVAFLLLRPRFGLAEGKKRLPWIPFWIGGGLALGFYDGFFGPGTGTFWAIALVGLAGLEMRGATAYTKVANFTSNIVSLGIFALAGTVFVPMGLAMGASSILGAWAGSHLVLKRGAGLVRGVLIGMSSAIVIYIALRYWVFK